MRFAPDRAVCFATVALAAAATFACEKPVGLTDTGAATVGRVAVSPNVITLYQGQVQDFVAVAFTADGDTARIDVSWSTTGGSITDTSSSGGRHYGQYQAGSTTGKFGVIATGQASGTADTAVVSVVRRPVASVAVSPAAASLQVGGTIQLTAVAKDSSGTILAGRAMTWSSSNSLIATVTSAGLATALAAGTATITATSEGKSGAASINVTLVPVASVTVSPASGSVLVGQTLQFAATVKDAGGNILTGRTVTWTSSNTAWATASSRGVVTGVAAGSVTVTATSEGQSGTAAIIVTNPAGFSPSCQQTAYLRLVEVATANDLHAALDSARAGDQIHLADGTYDANGWGFAVNVSGTAAHCIKLYGSPAAIIDANSLTGWDGLTLNGASYWTFEGFTITDALRAVIAFGAIHDYCQNLQIHHTGQAGIELKTSSTHNVIEASTIWDTGVAVAVWGEGIYIGTADIGGSDHCDSNAVVGNTMGPNVRAEHIDVKPGSDYGLIRDNAFDGTGEVEQLDNVNSWVSIDGNGWLVQHNSGHNVIRYGMKVEAPGTANLFTNNLIDETAGGDPQKYGFRIEAAAVGNILLCDNQVINAAAFRDDGLACQPTASSPKP